jgi:hypothetical protein
MKRLLSLAIVALAMSGQLMSPARASAQSASVTKVDPKAPAPRLPNGRPDFSGVWARPATFDLTRTFTNANGTSNKGEPNPLPFTKWGQAQWDNYNPPKNGDYAGSCMPFGWIRSFTPHPMQIVQNNEYIAFLFEQSTMFQSVNTENLPHRKDWPPTWFGDSRGRWEGDTLIIDVVNFNGYQKLGTIGHPMSDQSHLVMEFKRPDMGHIEFKWTLTDPKTYTRPIVNERVFVLTPDVELMEYACMEGNLQSLFDGAITPWLGPRDSDESVIPAKWEWTAYDLTKPQMLTGIVREVRWEEPLATIQFDVAGKVWDIVLGPPVRLDFRGINVENIKPGITATIQAVPSKLNTNEFRAETVRLGNNETDMR